MSRIILIFLFACLSFLSVLSQDRRKMVNSIKLGFVPHTELGYHVNLGYERKVHRRISVQANLGFWPFQIPRSDAFSHLNYHFSIEGRYFLTKTGKMIQNGFFVGPFFALDRDIGYYKGTLQPAFRQYWRTQGLTMGYQRIVADHLCLSLSIQPTYTNLITTDGFFPDGRPMYRHYWDSNPIIYARIEFGLIL